MLVQGHFVEWLYLAICVTLLKYCVNKKINKYLYNFDPLKPHFNVVKLGFTGVYIFFLISAHKNRLWVLVRTASTSRF